MSKMPSPRADRLREQREARYEAEQARQRAEKQAAPKSVRRAPAKPIKTK
jgi:hypothetical protein